MLIAATILRHVAALVPLAIGVGLFVRAKRTAKHLAAANRRRGLERIARNYEPPFGPVYVRGCALVLVVIAIGQLINGVPGL